MANVESYIHNMLIKSKNDIQNSLATIKMQFQQKEGKVYSYKIKKLYECSKKNKKINDIKKCAEGTSKLYQEQELFIKGIIENGVRQYSTCTEKAINTFKLSHDTEQLDVLMKQCTFSFEESFKKQLSRIDEYADKMKKLL